jgi:hypothetical protein
LRNENTGRKKGERPVGVPAARGHGGDGGADIRSGLRGPEHIVSVPVGGGGVDRPLGSFGASTKGLQNHFAAFSLKGLRTQPRAWLPCANSRLLLNGVAGSGRLAIAGPSPRA